jgi:MraZ protein
MITFIGTHECKLDGKADTASSKFAQAASGRWLQEFVLRRSIFSKCLELYPKTEWDKELEKINRLSRYQT